MASGMTTHLVDNLTLSVDSPVSVKYGEFFFMRGIYYKKKLVEKPWRIHMYGINMNGLFVDGKCYH